MEMAAELGLAINVVQAFETCIKAYRLLSDANNIDQDGSNFFSRLHWEHYRLLEWGKRTGLDSCTPSDQLNWGYATRLLGEQEAFLVSAAKMTARYSFEAVKGELSTHGEESKERQSNRFIDYLTRLRPELASSKTQAVRSKKGIIKRLRWASVDKDQANCLVLNIANINDRLQALLDSADREWMRHAISDLLRDIISRCDNTVDIDTIQLLLNPQSASSHDALCAAASLKQIRLLVGKGNNKGRNAVSSTRMPVLRQLSHSRLTAQSAFESLHYVGFEVCRYDGKDTLVDWRIVSEQAWVHVKGNMQRLALVLSKLNDPSFHTLPLLGLLLWQEEYRFGFIYELPCMPAYNDRPWRQVSLHALIKRCATASLTRRVEIATQMAETVLQFHTAGWLHKAIRSENIIFMTLDMDDTASLLSENAYLVGFDYARPDSKAGLAFTELPDASLLGDLYRHPNARGIHRQSYRKEFDMYGLGCLLLELALWKPLVEIVSITHGKQTQRSIEAAISKELDIVLPSFLDLSKNEDLRALLVHHAGNSVYEATKTCFSTEALGNGVTVQTRVLDQLRACKP